jgi:chorismate synthase
VGGSVFGKLLTVSTFGESHGPAVGVVVDGMPAGLPLEPEDVQKELNRRRPGQSAITGTPT